MGLYTFVYDSTAKATKRVAYPGFVDYTETISGSAKATFTLAVAIDSAHAIDVWLDGRMQMIENTNWSRTVGNPGQIVLAENANIGSVFKARVYLK